MNALRHLAGGLARRVRPADPAPRGGQVRRLDGRGGFTLTELLVTITVIGILAGLAMGGLHTAREHARVARTKATVAKLHNIVMEMYDSYPTRRVPVSTAGMTQQQAAAARLRAIRDIMRMEMPDQWSDVSNGPIYVPSRPALSQAYVAYRSGKAADPVANSSAKLLYMLVTVGNPEARGQFAENEVATDPNDGWSYFVDAWGRPIYFFRWAPGFLPPNSGLQTGNATDDHDPLDPMRVDSAAYRLVPLIYSGGPDGDSGLRSELYTWNNNTYTAPALTFGQPTGTAHFDNIHNHRLEVR